MCFRSAPTNNLSDGRYSHPLPAIRYRERDLVVYAGWLAPVPLGVDALLIVAAIGSAVDDALAALGRLQPSLRDKPAALLADAPEQDGRGLVRRVLRREPALHRLLQDGLAQAVGQLFVQLFAGRFEGAVFFDVGSRIFDYR